MTVDFEAIGVIEFCKFFMESSDLLQFTTQYVRGMIALSEAAKPFIRQTISLNAENLAKSNSGRIVYSIYSKK